MSGGFDITMNVDREEAAAKAAEQERRQQDAGQEGQEQQRQEKAPAAQEQQRQEQQPDTERQSNEEADRLGIPRADFSALREEFTANGKLSDETYAKLTQMGYEREDVDTYIEGVRARQEGNSRTLYEAVGGREEYQRMIQWAAQPTNVSAEQRQQFNSDINSGDMRRAQLAVEALYGRFTSKMGSQGSSRIRGAAPNQGQAVEGYANREEAVEAAREAQRTGKDRSPSWQAQHQEKMRAMLSRNRTR